MTKRTHSFHTIRSFSQERLSSQIFRSATIFAIGLVVGWFVFGWMLFPVAHTNIYPNELQPSAVNDYLLMTAESYGATGDLRTAAKRLRYWEPEQLAAMFNDLAQSVETSNPADAAYLQLLAKDLHLASAPHASATKPPSRSFQFNFLWVLAPILALAVIAGLILLAQRMGWLGQDNLRQAEADSGWESEAVTTPPETFIEETPPQLVTPPQALSQAIDDEISTITAPEQEQEDEDESYDEEALFFVEDDAEPGPEEAPDYIPDEAIDTLPEPEEMQTEAPVSASEAIPLPTPSYIDEVDVPDVEEGEPILPPQVLRFDGDPAYNTIIAIESDDEYLGEYGMSAGQTAPNNPNMVLTLEVWLFDKSDTQTTDIALAPPVVVADPDLKARYIKENMSVLPLQEGQIILLETAELRLEGRVRRVEFGATTNDGVPIIEAAEIEMLGKRK